MVKKLLSIPALPDDFPKEFTFRDLNQWFIENKPTGGFMGMTFEQEAWYRMLLRPEDILPRTVTFRGITIIGCEPIENK